MANQLIGPGPAPLVSARTVYLNSSTGNDSTGDGSTSRPWATLAKAWADRLTYSELRAIYTIQLLGVGPYTLPAFGASVCGEGGYLILQGDSAVDVPIASGTFTGDLVNATFTIPTSAGLGVDTLKTYFLEITSGNCAGTRTNIVINTDNSISIPEIQFRGVLGAIVNGDTFRVFAPGTVITVPAFVAGQTTPGCYDWIGGTLSGVINTGTVRVVRHIFYNVSLTSTGPCCFANSAINFVGVRTTGTQSIQFYKAHVSLGFQNDASLLVGGAPAINFKYTAYGLSISAASSLSMNGDTIVWGNHYFGGFLNIFGDAYLQTWGGRFDGGGQIGSNARLEVFSSTVEFFYCTKTFTLFQRGILQLSVGGSGKWVFAVTSGSCIVLQKGSYLGYGSFGTTGISGGTTDPAGYALEFQSISHCVVHGGAMALTGGRPGADIKTPLLPAQPGTALAAVGDFISDLGGGVVIARV